MTERQRQAREEDARDQRTAETAAAMIGARLLRYHASLGDEALPTHLCELLRALERAENRQ